MITPNETHTNSRISFGFWMYLMTDFVLFAGLFAVYAVLHTNVFGGPYINQIITMPLVLAETLLLLSSSFTSGLALLAAHKNKKQSVLLWLGATFILGASFVAIEFNEFAHLVAAGNGPSHSAFLSSYFTLVGTHGLHVTLGLVWMLALISAISMRGLTHGNIRKLELLTMFWHFLELIWIFIFTIVYMLGIL